MRPVSEVESQELSLEAKTDFSGNLGIKKNILNFLAEGLWNLWCLVSVIGIWPRFIEPNLLKVSHLKLGLTGLKDVRILQISDLHFNAHFPKFFQKKIIQRINTLSPDLIVFTGDFLCYAKTNHLDGIKKFLCQLKATHGCFAILGNHDYAEFVSVNDQGQYDIVKTHSSTIIRGFQRLFSPPKLVGEVTKKAQAVGMNEPLLAMLKETPFKVLHNETIQLSIRNQTFNLTGVGEYSLGKCDPKNAFKNYCLEHPGIILSHHPDSIKILKDFPGNIILSGHTHGGQINLPWIWKKFTLMEDMTLIKGLIHTHNKTIYINRGLGSALHFRWFSQPEVLLIQTESDGKD